MRRPATTTALGVAIGALIVVGLGVLLASLINLTGSVREQEQAEKPRAEMRAALAADVEALRSQLLALGQVPDAGPPAAVQPGPPGREGRAGPPGRPGDPGADGAAFVGPPGAPGAPGGAGSPGASGTTGQSGADSTVPGPSGADGRDGADSTVPGPSGRDGADSTVPGPQGERGEPGADGRPPESFTFTDRTGKTFRCADPDGDGNYDCESTDSGPGLAPGGP